MFTHQTTGFRTKLKHRQRGSIIHIQRCIQQILQFIIQLLPFIIRQLSAFYFLTRNLADIRNQTIHQLDITHFKRKQRYRVTIIDGYILRHRKDESCLPHRRTGGNNNKVGVLPTGSHLVQLRKTTFKATQSVRSCRCLLNQLIRFVNHRIDLRVVLLHVLLRNLKKLSFGFLHQIVHIQRFIKRLTLNVTGKSNQLARQ